MILDRSWRSPHPELETLLADLKLGERLDGDLRHAHPQPVLGLVVFGVPYTACLAVHPDMPRLAERVIGAADCTGRVGADPVLGLGEQNSVADFVTEHLRQGGRPAGRTGVGPAMSLGEVRFAGALVGRRTAAKLGSVELVAPAADQEFGPIGQASGSRGRTARGCSEGR